MKNRTAIGIVCIILAVAITFVVSPMVNKVSDKKTETVRFTTNVTHGTKIKETDVEVVKISNSALPDKVVKNKTEIVGKYATADLFKGDIATENKITDNANTASDVMASLKGNKVAMSITINSFAGGLSGKLQNGDVVSICVTDKDNKTEIPAELKYVKVITTTTSGGMKMMLSRMKTAALICRLQLRCLCRLNRQEYLQTMKRMQQCILYLFTEVMTFLPKSF